MPAPDREHYLDSGPTAALATIASGVNPDSSAFQLTIINPMPIQATPIAAGAGDAQAFAATAGLRLYGWSARESAGAVASFVLRNGTGAGDPARAFCNLASGQTQTQFFGPEGIDASAGIFLDRTAGSCEVVVYAKVLT